MNKNPNRPKNMNEIMSKTFNPKESKIKKINKEVSDIIERSLNKEWKK